MTATILYVYGVIVIASAIMIVAWGKAATDLWRSQGLTIASSVWCKAFVISSALTVTACAMVALCAYRCFDIIWHNLTITGSDAGFLLAGMVWLALSKIAFVWAGSIEESGRRVRWPWWMFIYWIIVWGVFVLAWQNGRIM